MTPHLKRNSQNEIEFSGKIQLEDVTNFIESLTQITEKLTIHDYAKKHQTMLKPNLMSHYEVFKHLIPDLDDFERSYLARAMMKLFIIFKIDKPNCDNVEHLVEIIFKQHAFYVYGAFGKLHGQNWNVLNQHFTQAIYDICSGKCTLKARNLCCLNGGIEHDGDDPEDETFEPVTKKHKVYEESDEESDEE